MEQRILKKILVVDDEPLVLRLTKRILEQHGYEVLIATSGEEALRLCEQHRDTIDLVVSDVRMPKMSGIELAGCISGLPHPIPVILMSGFPQSSTPVEELSFPGARHFLTKPFSAPELVETISAALAERSNPG